jgi:hypothetical protein
LKCHHYGHHKDHKVRFINDVAKEVSSNVEQLMKWTQSMKKALQSQVCMFNEDAEGECAYILRHTFLPLKRKIKIVMVFT